uniref:SHSP domain-containing protein n=1 Tax=Caenorhabditis japonica TaxID=281687 RepID=A0A8R1EFZ5_CAEJA
MNTGSRYSNYSRHPLPSYHSPHYHTPALARRPASPGPVAGAGEIINTSHGFTIELDVFKFAPEEIKLVLTDDTLSISGERFELTGDGQTLRRSFSRKYSIPEDVCLDTIRSHLTNSGVLVINGSRKGWRETNISTQRSGTQRSSSRNFISTV